MYTRHGLIVVLIVIVVMPTIGIHAERAHGSPPQSRPAAQVSSPAGGLLGSTFLIADQSVDTKSPAIAYNSQRQEYLVVWYNDRAGCDDIYAQRVAGNGALIGSWFCIAAGCTPERRYPDVAYNVRLNEYLVVWEHYNGTYYVIHGQRVGATGLLVGGEIDIASGPDLANRYRPAVAYAYTSDLYFVVWENCAVGGLSCDIKGQVLSGAGTVVGSSVYVAQGTIGFSNERPDIAYNRRRNEYLVVWQRLDKGANLYGIYARVVHGSGSPLFPETINIQQTTISNTAPSVAAIPTATAVGQYLVVWELLYVPPNDRDIYGRIVAGDGTPGTGFWISWANAIDEHDPAVAGDETAQRYIANWVQPAGAPWVFQSIRGAPISTAAVVGTTGTVGGVIAERPAVASGPTGDFLTAFDDVTLTANVDIYGRLWGNRLYLPLVMK